jgi:hypothetical protein
MSGPLARYSGQVGRCRRPTPTMPKFEDFNPAKILPPADRPAAFVKTG